jgi:hypothetical protein
MNEMDERGRSELLRMTKNILNEENCDSSGEMFQMKRVGSKEVGHSASEELCRMKRTVLDEENGY